MTFTNGQILTAEQLNTLALATDVSASAKLSDLSDSTGSNLVGTTTGGTGSVTRTVKSKLNDIASVKDFGAVGDGVTDDTEAIQAAINSGSASLYIPHGTYLFSSLTMPTTTNFILYGEGTSSILKQTGTGIKWPVIGSAANLYASQTIKDISFNGTSGTGNTLDTSYVGSIDLLNLYFLNVPTGFSSLYIDGNVPFATNTHDVRLDRIRIYHNSGASAVSGITFGAKCSDTDVSNVIMNANVNVDYCIRMLSGANAVSISDSHPYNAKINVLAMQGNSYCQFSNNTFDYALSDVVNITNSFHCVFTNNYFEAIHNTFSGVNVNTNSSDIAFVNNMFLPLPAILADSAIKTDATTSYISIFGGSIGVASLYTQLFNILGTFSYATQIPGYQGNAYFENRLSVGTPISGGFSGTIQLSGYGSPTSGTVEGITSSMSLSTNITSRHDAFLSAPKTDALSFTLANLRHYTAQQGTFGAGSAVTNQFGFYADASLTGAVNNYGFYANIAATAGRYNFYANGTAANFFAGDMQLGKIVAAAGTTGAQTINKTCGTVNFAAAATSLVVTNSLVTVNSIVICTVGTNDTTMKSANAVAAAGSFTINANAAATAETRVNFLVIN